MKRIVVGLKSLDVKKAVAGPKTLELPAASSSSTPAKWRVCKRTLELELELERGAGKHGFLRVMAIVVVNHDHSISQ